MGSRVPLQVAMAEVGDVATANAATANAATADAATPAASGFRASATFVKAKSVVCGSGLLRVRHSFAPGPLH